MVPEANKATDAVSAGGDKNFFQKAGDEITSFNKKAGDDIGSFNSKASKETSSFFESAKEKSGEFYNSAKDAVTHASEYVTSHTTNDSKK